MSDYPWAEERKAQRREIERLQKRVAEVGAELIDTLESIMLRCSSDDSRGYEIMDPAEVARECDTTCKCPLDCAVYQRWVDLTSPEQVHADSDAADGKAQ